MYYSVEYLKVKYIIVCVVGLSVFLLRIDLEWRIVGCNILKCKNSSS